MSELKRTQLYDAHVAAGADMVDFGGWEMPIQYPTGIVAEHLYTRHACGLFDVSHMGQVLVEGKDAWAFLQYVNCNNIKNTPGAGTYSHMLTERGTIIDDLIAFCLTPEKFLVVVNAACREEDVAWLQKHAYDCRTGPTRGGKTFARVGGRKRRGAVPHYPGCV